MEDIKLTLIDKLNDQNWANWKFKIRLILEELNLWDIVTGEETIETVEENQRGSFNQRLRKAFRIIALNVDDQNLSLIRQTTDPSQAWLNLTNHFERVCLANQFYLRKRLLNIKYNNGDNMVDHINKITDIKQQLESINQHVDENDLVITLLQSLPSDYENLIVSLESQFGSDEIDFEFAKSRVVEEYHRKLNLKQNDILVDQTSALATQKVKKFLNKNNNNDNGDKRKGKGKRPGKCNYCKAPGHWFRECPKKAMDDANKSKDNSCQNNTKVSALMVTVGKRFDNNWYLDSGATSHMANDRDWFIDFNPIETYSISLADNSEIEAKGIGTVRIKVKHNDYVDLSNTLYVPNLGKNLLSLSAIDKKGCNVLFANGKFTVKGQHCEDLFEGQVVNGLYQINVEPYFIQANITEKNNNNCVMLWHRRLGHLNIESIKKLVKVGKLPELDSSNEKEIANCESCLFGKQTRKPFESSTTKSVKCGDLIHSDIAGPMSVESLGGNKYYQTFIDDYSRKTFVYLLKSRDQSYSAFSTFIMKFKNQMGSMIKAIRTDNAREFSSKQFTELLTAHGIEHQLTVRFCPEQNGIAERMNRTIMDIVRTMLNDTKLSEEFWAEAVHTAVYLYNRRPHSAIDFKLPEEVYYDKQVELSNIRVFGSYCYVHVPKEKRQKLDSKSKKCIFIGYPDNQRGYKIWDNNEGKMIVSRDVFFNENLLTIDAANVSKVKPQDPPLSMSELRTRSDRDIWFKAAQEEIQSLNDNETWELVDVNDDMNIIDSKWVFSYKYNADGTIEKAKARLVAKGFKQKPFIDYIETFAPVSKFVSIRIILTVAMMKKMLIVQMDVKTAFLNGTLIENIYMRQPEGFTVDENKVCKLKKSIYGLKQAAMVWNTEIDNHLKSLGFINLSTDTCIYKRKTVLDEMFIILYVDDLIVIGTDEKCLHEFGENLKQKFELKILPNLDQFLGINIKWDKTNNVIELSQERYIVELLERFNFNDCKSVKTPFECNVKFELTSEKQSNGFITKYQSAIGSLNYLVTCTRPDLSIIVSILSQFNSNPSQVHWSAVKRVFRYLKSTMTISIMLGKDKGPIDLLGYADSDWGGDRFDRKSYTGYIFILNNSPISWNSKKQPTVALSTTEAEYMALTSATKEAIWLKQLFNEIGISIETVKLFGDNQGALKLSKNPVFHARTKHIDIQYHFIREAIKTRQINLDYIPSESNIADLLTKPLHGPRFIKLLKQILSHV